MKHLNAIFASGLLVAGLCCAVLLSGCAAARKTTAEKISFYEVGHRGARGLMAENTIPSFEKAIEVGANTIEFDVHITKDHKVVVYHDNSFNPAYTLRPDGSEIPQSQRKAYTFYQMDYADIRQFIIGQKRYDAYPEQQPVKAYAPLMSEMIDAIEAFTKAHDYPPVVYLLEVKSNPQTDGFEQPEPEEYMRIMMQVLTPYLQQIKGRLIIQSFDMRPLQVLHSTHPDIPLGYLTGDKSKGVEQNLEVLGFVPEFYNPHYALVDAQFLTTCHNKGMKVLPWTVEKKGRMEQLIALGVDGIITDYPNRLEEVVARKK